MKRLPAESTRCSGFWSPSPSRSCAASSRESPISGPRCLIFVGQVGSSPVKHGTWGRKIPHPLLHRLGWWDILQARPYLMVKKTWFSVDFTLNQSIDYFCGWCTCWENIRPKRAEEDQRDPLPRLVSDLPRRWCTTWLRWSRLTSWTVGIDLW